MPSGYAVAFLSEGKESGMSKRVAVLLSGCGVYDGSEIHEAVLTLLALGRAGVDIRCVAPNDDQYHVVDHCAGAPAANERRNMMIEAARLARGEIKPLGELQVDEVDALIMPGGFGAAKNLCDYAIVGRDCTVRSDVRAFVETLFQAGKPLGAMCIAPVIVARVLGDKGIKVTIGSDEKTAADIEAFGATHVVRQAHECLVDTEHRIVTTPAYMNASGIADVARGVDALVQEVLAMLP